MLVAPRVAKNVGEGRLGGLSLALWGMGLGFLAVVGDSSQALILGEVIGFIGGGLVPMGSFAQSETPDEMRVRVGANLMVANLALVPVTFIQTGFLMDSVGPRPLYAISGLVVAVCGLALVASRVVRDVRLVPQAGADLPTLNYHLRVRVISMSVNQPTQPQGRAICVVTGCW
jgi:hypothetical protein